MTMAASVGVGQQAEQRRQQQHGGQRRARRDSARLSASRPPAACTTAVCDVPPPAGIAPNRAPARFAAPVATSSAIGVDRRIRRRGEGAPGGDRLGEAHQRDAERTRCAAAATSARSGSVSDGRPCGISPTVDTPSAFQIEEPRRGNATGHRNQRCRRVRPQPLHRR